MELEPMTLIVIAIIVIVISLAILSYLICVSVKKALREGDYWGRARVRLLIMKMLKDGYTKDEIVKTIDSEEIDFWNSINGVTEDSTYLDELKKSI